MLDVDVDGLTVFIFFEDHKLGVFDDFFWSFPLKIFELRSPLWGDGLILVELSVGAGKLRIGPFFTRMVG